MAGKRRSQGEPAGEEGVGGLGDVLRGLGGFVDLFSKLAEQGTELKRSGEIGDDKGVKAVYGFSVRVGGPGKPSIEPFGNVRQRGSKAVVEEVREPMVDVFDEGDHLIVVAEVPGVEAGDLQFEVKGDVLTLTASRGERKYRREVLLPSAVRAEETKSSYRNGVFELKLAKQR